MHRNNPAARFRLLCLTFFISGVAAAAEPSSESPIGPETDNVTIGQLEAAQAKNLLLEQKVQTARLQRQLRDSENGALTDTPVMTSPFPPAGSGKFRGPDGFQYSRTACQKQLYSLPYGMPVTWRLCTGYPGLHNLDTDRFTRNFQSVVAP